MTYYNREMIYNDANIRNSNLCLIDASSGKQKFQRELNISKVKNFLPNYFYQKKSANFFNF